MTYDGIVQFAIVGLINAQWIVTTSLTDHKRFCDVIKLKKLLLAIATKDNFKLYAILNCCVKNSTCLSGFVILTPEYCGVFVGHNSLKLCFATV